MKIGPFIRGIFGPYERHVSEAYRSIYIDIDSFVEQTRRWQPSAKKILEVGCGEGAVTQRLRAAYPGVDITAIDITGRIGRLYQGSANGVRFMQCTVQEIAATNAAQFDMVLMCDVLHHVPLELRRDLLDAVRALLHPNGTFIFKDWQRSHTPIHWLCYASDRWVTGDRISYMTREEMRRYVARSFGETALMAESTIRPWSNNIAMLVRPNAIADPQDSHT